MELKSAITPAAMLHKKGIVVADAWILTHYTYSADLNIPRQEQGCVSLSPQWGGRVGFPPELVGQGTGPPEQVADGGSPVLQALSPYSGPVTAHPGAGGLLHTGGPGCWGRGQGEPCA